MANIKTTCKSVLVICALLGFIFALSACETQKNSRAGRESHTLHFKLPNVPLANGERHVLHAGNAVYTLKQHDAESTDKYSDLFDKLEEEREPSHYVEEVDLPADRPLLITVTKESNTSSGPSSKLELVAIHVSPRLINKSLRSGVKKAQFLASKGVKLERRYTLAADGSGDDADDDDDDGDDDVINTHDVGSIAATLAYHHPEIMQLDGPGATKVMEYIRFSPAFAVLESAIRRLQKTSSDGIGWYKESVLTDSKGNPVKDTDGSVLSTYDLDASVESAMATLMTDVLTKTKNDPFFSGKTFHPVTAAPFATADSGDQDGDVDDETADGDSLSVRMDPLNSTDKGYSYRLSHTGFKHGFRSRVKTSGDGVQLSMENNYVRHLSVFLRFFDEKDNPVEPEGWSYGDIVWDELYKLYLGETKFAALISPVKLVMGIPLGADTTTEQISFSWPKNARYAKILAGGLGRNGSNESEIVWLGASLTSVLELGLPIVLLACDAFADNESPFSKTDIALMALQIANFGFSTTWEAIGKDNSSLKTKKILANVVNFITSNSALSKYLIRMKAESRLKQSIPFIGWALAAIDATATVAALDQTCYETIESPWIIENRIQPTHNINVTIAYDHGDSQFPASAVRYRVIASFSDSETSVIEKTLPGGIVKDPQTVTFQNVPAGGNITISTIFYAKTGWIAGQASSGEIPNHNDTNSTFQTVNLTLKENLVPLTKDTSYEHKVTLSYSNGVYGWTNVAPRETYLALNDSTAAHSLSDLVDITFNLSDEESRLGYVFKSYAPNMVACSSSHTVSPLYFVKNINLSNTPGEGMLTSSCGYTAQPYLLYSSSGSASTGPHFIVTPDEQGKFFYARPLTLIGQDGAFDISKKSYGRFSARVDGMVYHPSGKLIAISKGNRKLYMLDTTKELVDDNNISASQEASSALGPALTLEGMAANPALLRNPISIRLSSDNMVMVLDNISDLAPASPNPLARVRLRAFSETGTPLAAFPGDLAYLDLEAPAADKNVAVTYLDFNFESKSYIYLLSYSHNDNGTPVTANNYRLDVYSPDGVFLNRTTGVAAARLAVDVWRNVYTLNYQSLALPTMTEPSVSEWIPSTPQYQ